MLFRPEEVHVRSTERPGGRITPDLGTRVTDRLGRVDRADLLVEHLDHDRLTAAQAGSIDAHLPTGDEPSDRERLESALGELARERWRRATGDEIDPNPTEPDHDPLSSSPYAPTAMLSP